MEYVLMQRARLGCKVDGGGHKSQSYTHEDAEIVAATLAEMPNSLGGIRMAISVAELARAGMTPNWMPGAVPRCVPVDMKRNRHGDRAVSVVVGTEKILVCGKWRTVEVRACPVTFSPAPQQIEAARRGYEDWWQALDWVRDGLVAGRMLQEMEVTAVMPKVRPWGPK
jgi:thiazole synthase ThiGH ThiG subunit